MSQTQSLFCPAENKSFSPDNPCEHYKKYGYKKGDNPEFFIKLIKEGYIPNSKKPGGFSKSQYAGTLKNSVCKHCGKSFNHKNRVEQDAHESQCRRQQKL